jgi:hypothetical protein
MKQIELLYSGNTDFNVGDKIIKNSKKYLIISKYWKSSDLCEYEIVEI